METCFWLCAVGKAGRNQFFNHPTLLFPVFQCHTQIHCAISKVDVEKDIQALMEETAILSIENKSELLLADYFVSMEGQEVPLPAHLGHVLRSQAKNNDKKKKKECLLPVSKPSSQTP